MAARISKIKRNSNSKGKGKGKGKGLKGKKAARTANIHLAIGLSVIGLAGYVLGQGIEKAVSYA